MTYIKHIGNEKCILASSCSMGKKGALNKNDFRAPLRSGFTLIELLVVVLIIGILAAVALPQYQKALNKTRTMRMLPLMKAIVAAEHVYHLTHGSYTIDFTQLDIEMPAGGTVDTELNENSTLINRLIFSDFSCHLQLQNYSDEPEAGIADQYVSLYCIADHPNAPEIEKYLARDYWICWGPEAAGEICKAITGQQEPTLTSMPKGGKVGYKF